MKDRDLTQNTWITGLQISNRDPRRPCFFPHKDQPSVGGNINGRSEPGGDVTTWDFYNAQEQRVYWTARSSAAEEQRGGHP